jgi:hypothetical protein
MTIPQKVCRRLTLNDGDNLVFAYTGGRLNSFVLARFTSSLSFDLGSDMYSFCILLREGTGQARYGGCELARINRGIWIFAVGPRTFINEVGSMPRSVIPPRKSFTIEWPPHPFLDVRAMTESFIVGYERFSRS